MRFKDGWPETIGGWKHLEGSSIDGICRSIWFGRDDSLNAYVVYGTENGLYGVRSGTEKDITPAGFSAGGQRIILGTGYGVGTYGTGDYGVDRSAYATIGQQVALVWSMYTSWGDDELIVCPTLGSIYSWGFDFNTPTVVAVVANAPTGNLGVMVTAEQHVVALGASNDFLKIKWASQGNKTLWTPAATNTAGEWNLAEGNIIRSWRKAQDGLYLVWTDSVLYTMQYVGYPDVYVFRDLVSNTGCISQMAVADVGGTIYWMGETNFWMWRGGRPRAMICPLERDIFDGIDGVNKRKVCAGINKEFHEIWWFYPADGQEEPDKLVIYNYEDGSWSGPYDMARTAMTIDAELNMPLAASAVTNKIYEHENGEDEDGTPMTTAYIKAPPMEEKNGERTLRASEIIPDFMATNGCQIELEGKLYPKGAARTYGPFTFGNSTTRKPFKANARQFAITHRSHPSGGFFRVQDTRFRYGLGGER